MSASAASLPRGLTERIRALAAGELPVSTTRDAATIALVRDTGTGDGVEVYLLRRVSSMAFAAGMHVFPGGSVDPADADTAVGWVGPSAADWAAELGASEPLARALVCAAVRETFEESGVLLAGETPDAVVDVSDSGWEVERAALEAREHSMSELLARRGLVLRADLLRAWSHWITPEVEPRRFDTRFFVAALPPGQRTRVVGGESDRTVWLPARDAVDRAARGELAMLAPTAQTLADLAEYATVDDVLAARRRVRPLLPRFALDAGEVRMLLPDEPGYAEAPAGA